MYVNFFKHIDIDTNNVNILDGNADDLQAEYNATVAAAAPLTACDS